MVGRDNVTFTFMINDRQFVIKGKRMGAVLTEIQRSGDGAARSMNTYDKSVLNAGRSTAASAVNFQTATQGLLNLSTAIVQTYTSISNLDRANNRAKMSVIAVARAEDLLNNKIQRRNDMQAQGISSGGKYNNMLREISTATADLTVKQEKQKIEQAAVNDIYMLFASNIANVTISSLQTVGVLLGHERTARLGVVAATKLQSVVLSRHIGITEVSNAAVGKSIVRHQALTFAKIKGMVATKQYTAAVMAFTRAAWPLLAVTAAVTAAYLIYENNILGAKDKIDSLMGVEKSHLDVMKDERDQVDGLTESYDSLSGSIKKLTPVHKQYLEMMRDATLNTGNYKEAAKYQAQLLGGPSQGFSSPSGTGGQFGTGGIGSGGGFGVGSGVGSGSGGFSGGSSTASSSSISSPVAAAVENAAINNIVHRTNTPRGLSMDVQSPYNLGMISYDNGVRLIAEEAAEKKFSWFQQNFNQNQVSASGAINPYVKDPNTPSYLQTISSTNRFANNKPNTYSSTQSIIESSSMKTATPNPLGNKWDKLVFDALSSKKQFEALNALRDQAFKDGMLGMAQQYSWLANGVRYEGERAASKPSPMLDKDGNLKLDQGAGFFGADMANGIAHTQRTTGYTPTGMSKSINYGQDKGDGSGLAWYLQGRDEKFDINKGGEIFYGGTGGLDIAKHIRDGGSFGRNKYGGGNPFLDQLGRIQAEGLSFEKRNTQMARNSEFINRSSYWLNSKMNESQSSDMSRFRGQVTTPLWKLQRNTKTLSNFRNRVSRSNGFVNGLGGMMLNVINKLKGGPHIYSRGHQDIQGRGGKVSGSAVINKAIQYGIKGMPEWMDIINNIPSVNRESEDNMDQAREALSMAVSIASQYVSLVDNAKTTIGFSSTTLGKAHAAGFSGVGLYQNISLLAATKRTNFNNTEIIEESKSKLNLTNSQTFAIRFNATRGDTELQDRFRYVDQLEAMSSGTSPL